MKNNRPRVLVIEDDGAIRRGIADALRFEGYEPIQARTAAEGRARALGDTYDLLLLDLVLPGGDGLDILEALRAERPTTPVIVLTARGEERDRVRGLRLGADDYVVKPFSVRELLARVAAVLRRSPERPSDLHAVRFRGGVADLDRAEVRFDDGARETLSEKEVELLGYLARNAGRVISRKELLARVWRLDLGGMTTRTIDMHIARLRAKLREDPAAPAVVLTVHGRGYSFAVEE